MKKLSLVLSLILCLSLLAACGSTPAPEAVPTAEPTPEVTTGPEPTEEPAPAFVTVEDGRDRPSNRGQLQVIDGSLCGEDGQPVMLRGVSSYGLPMGDGFVNEPLFYELSQDLGVNVFRLAMYTYGVGAVGYCTGGNQEQVKQTVLNGVELAAKADMYAIVDWHVLQDGDPNQFIDEAMTFFAEVSETLADCNNVLYEICNEPNGVEWPDIKSYAESVIPVIRENDPDSVIIVGTPIWSQRVDEAAKDPLEFDNLLYTLHFYSATHKDELRAVAQEARDAGLPIFVTEYGITAASGGFPRDLEEADRWIDFLEEEGISYCMWSFSKIPEPCSAIRNTCLKYNGFTEEDYTETGLWLIETLKNHK